MTDAAALERGYRRWLRWYPRKFRVDHEPEILGVLMAGAQEGRRRPELVECLDLMRSGMWMRLRPSLPRSDRAAFTTIRLMCAGAVLELAVAVTMLVTIGDIKASLVARIPGFAEADWRAVVAGRIAPIIVAAGLAIGFWLWMAWSTGRGHRWSPFAFAVFFALNTYSLITGLVQGSAVFARADLSIAIVLWLFELAAVALIFRRRVVVSRAGTGRITPNG